MKKITTILAVAGLFGISNLYAQEDCKVLLADISGKYEGDCKKGKAEGVGKALGADEYSGEFKSGYPDGRGTYKWKNGNVYDGNWAKGKREGEGRMSIKRDGKADSIVTGFWKKDEFMGKFEKPYIVHRRTNHISKVDVRRGKESGHSIQIDFTSTSSGVPKISGTITPKIEISEIILAQGSYSQIQHVSSTTRATVKKLVDVTFPFRARIRFGSQEVDLEIQEPGSWITAISLNE